MGANMSMTPDVAALVMKEVGAGEHIAAFRLNGRSRAAVPLFSLAALSAYLTHDDVCIDPDGLVEWVRNTVGDTDLADVLLEANSTRLNNYERVREAAALITERVSEAQAVLM